MLFNGGLLLFALILSLPYIAADRTSADAYDFIVIGAGAGGCPLTKTLVDGGQKVLLVERGKERNPVTFNIKTSGAALQDECAEKFSSDGVVLAVGNCMGGATAFNQGTWILETPKWLKENVEALVGQDQFFDIDTIKDAYDWATDQVAQVTEEMPGTGTETFIDEMLPTLGAQAGIYMTNMNGQPIFPGGGTVFRTFSTFESGTGNRRSADTMLDRDNVNLDIMTKTQVEKILFDGDDGVPSSLQKGVKPGALPTARCVRFVQGGVECVKIGGRIYISAGAFHTPELLMKSGIGRDGVVVENDEVGQHLNDKPVVVTAYNFDPDFDLDGFITYVNIAAAVENNYGDGGGERRMLVTEPFSLGLPGAVDFLAFNRALFPSTLRDSNLAALVTEYLLLCDSSAGNTNPVCIPNIPFKEAGCTKQIAIVASYVGNISSEGSVSIGVNGTLEVDCNHLNSREDIEAFGAHARRGFDLVGALDGESAPEYPCDTKKNPTCALTTCPNLFKTLQDLILLGITLLYPKEAKQFQYKKEAEASMIFPNNIEQLVKQGLDDYELGKILRTNVVSSYHYAGTARFGSVIDSRFKVKGTDGLYVADSSALPKSTRVNAMATTVAIGRLAGISALREVWRPLHTQLQTSPADYET